MTGIRGLPLLDADDVLGLGGQPPGRFNPSETPA